MVDIKREDITLQDRTKGISADEFAWGSYFYAEWIQTWYNTKWFKLGYRLANNVINYRSDGYPVAISPAWDYWMTIFTHDRRLETSETYNGSLDGTWDSDGWGALYSQQANVTTRWVNWITYWTNAIAIRQSYIDVIDRDGLFNPASELLTNTKFDSDRTLGTWWTLNADNWVDHTTWETWTLTATFTSTWTRTRLAIKVINRTEWYVEIDAWGPADRCADNWWFVTTNTLTAWTATLTITPSSTFDGTIVMANVHEYATWKIDVGKASITTADEHPAIIWGGDLYIWSWNKVDIVSLTDRWVITKSIVDKNETIIDITQQAWNLILWTTDGYNSRQYYWNWVDSVATECIEWKWLLIKWVTNTETVCYVLTTAWSTTGTIDGYEYRLYAVSWYQRNLMACKKYYLNSRENINKPQYNIQKKFDFDDTTSSKSMCMFLDSLYLPWCDGVYKYGNEIPWMRAVWSRPVRYPFGSTRIMLGQNGVYFVVAYTNDGVNYVAEVNPQRYVDSWYLVTESIYWDKLSTRKALEKLKIWYKNVAAEDGNIKVYAIVDDDYFWRFAVSGITNRPAVWDVYTVANQTKAEVIDVDKVNNIITFRTIQNLWSYLWASNSSLTKISGDGDNSITITWYDNMCLLKTIESDVQGYGSDFIFSKDFVNTYLPYWYKIQFVIEINSIDHKLTPEIYEISIRSDITDVVL